MRKETAQRKEDEGIEVWWGEREKPCGGMDYMSRVQGIMKGVGR